MDLANFLLIIVGSLNLIIGFYVYFKNWKSQLRLSFLLLTIGVALWSLSLALSNVVIFNSLTPALFWSRTAYITSAFIAFSFLWLCILFPFELRISIKKWFSIFIPFLLLLASFIVYPSLVIIELSQKAWGYDGVYNTFGYIIFSFYFIAYMALGFYFLIKRYLISDGIIRNNLKLLIVGLGFGAIFGIIFDLILPFGNYWQLNWLGPYFSLFMVFSVAYMITKK